MRLLLLILVISFSSFSSFAQSSIFSNMMFSYEPSPLYMGQGDSLYTANICIHSDSLNADIDRVTLIMTHQTDHSMNILLEFPWSELVQYRIEDYSLFPEEEETPFHFDIPIADGIKKNYSQLTLKLKKSDQTIESHPITIQ